MPCNLHIVALELAWVFLATVVGKHGMLRKLIFNRDLHFTSRFWHKLIAILSCEHAISTTYYSQLDRQTECIQHSVE